MRASLLTFIGLAAQGAGRVFTSIAIGRVGGAESLGITGAGIALTQLLILLGPTSAAAAATKFIARWISRGDHETLRGGVRHLGHVLLMTTLLLTVVGALRRGIQYGLEDGMCIAVLVAGYSGYVFTRGSLYGQGRIARAVIGDCACAAAGLAGLMVMLELDVRGVALVLPLGVASLAYATLNWPRAGGPRTLGDRERREVDGFIALGVVGTLTSAGFLQSSMLVAHALSGSAEAGLYYAALSLATPAAIFGSAIGLVVFPRMSAAHSRGDDTAFRQTTDRGVRVASFVLILVFGAVMICSRLVVQVVWGPTFEGSADVLRTLLMAVLLLSLGSVTTSALTSRSQRGMWQSTVISLAGAATGILCWLIAAPRYGIEGVAAGYLVGVAVTSMVPLLLVARRDQHQWASLGWKVCLGVLTLAAVMAWQSAAEWSDHWDPGYAGVFVAIWVFLRPDGWRTPTDGASA